MRAHALSVLTVVALAGSGCSVSSLLEKSQKQNEEAIDIVCSCDEIFPDAGECVDLFSQFLFLDPDDQCIIDALETDKGASRDTLNCIIDTQKDYNRCLEDKLDCSDPSFLMECQDIINEGIDSCPELPEAVDDELGTCG